MCIRDRFDRASDLLGFSVPELCFEPNDRLDITEYTQAAMVTTSIAMMKVLEERGIHPDVAAGLSLGEYCALAAAGVMSEDDAIRTVRQRGIPVSYTHLDVYKRQVLCSAVRRCEEADCNSSGNRRLVPLPSGSR